MIVELISTGSELLLGDTVNTNVSWLAQEFNKLGYTTAYQSVVGDNPGVWLKYLKKQLNVLIS